MPKLSLQSEVFTRGIAEIITRAELQKLLSRGKKLRVKHGIDATSPDLHIGHAANLWKLRALQEAGHKAVILLGDVTTTIGDPTGREKTRPVLSSVVIKKNIAAIEKQVRAILLARSAVFELRRSSEWYGKMRLQEFLKLLSWVTHARLIARDMFQERIRAGKEIYLNELIYPILQGYDSVMLKSDLTVIGADQLFNEHVGRFLQEKFGQAPQILVALKILPGLDGGAKMSKSLGNAIALTDSPRDKFGKAMRLLDSLIVSYLEVYTDVPTETVRRIKEELGGGANPMQAKLFFAQELVRRYHGEKIAELERERFLHVFSKREMPPDIPEFRLQGGSRELLAIVMASGLVSSKSEARRLIRAGAVSLDGIPASDPSQEVELRDGVVLRVGKRRFVKLKTTA